VLEIKEVREVREVRGKRQEARGIGKSLNTAI